MLFQHPRIADSFAPDEHIVVYPGDCMELLRQVPDGALQLIVTSPPYNLGKEYERRLNLPDYIAQQRDVISECVRALAPTGSICWQVGNYVDRGAIIPLDTVLYPLFTQNGLRMRNRIIWHFEHGLHCKRRFSGRYETIIWFTKSDDYIFNLDPVRVPRKYPGKKYFKGPRPGSTRAIRWARIRGTSGSSPTSRATTLRRRSIPASSPWNLSSASSCR